jgi:Predicted membrane protein
MNCPNCGAEVKEGDTFCGECGTGIRADSAGVVAKTALGLNENIGGLLCYSLGWLSGLIFLLLEKENKFIRFHAIQSLITFLSISLLYLFVTSLVPAVTYSYNLYYGWTSTPNPVYVLIVLLVGFISLILWLLLMYKAYKGEKFKLPLIGDFAEQHI